MKQVIIYTQPDCPPCEITKLYLKDKGIEYIEKNIKEQQNLRELTEQHCSSSTPTVVIGEKVITGFNLNEIDSVLSREID